jgi:hypothetical protein
MPRDPYKKVDPLWIGVALILALAIAAVLYIVTSS